MGGDRARADVLAVVLTFRRPRLATGVVRQLIEVEGLDPGQVLLVVNGDGGLEDPDLTRRIEVLRLPENVGPAGGFRQGLVHATRSPHRWFYLCEDDVGLFDLPTPRLARLVAEVEALEAGTAGGAQVGGVVAYGRCLDPRTGATRPFPATEAKGLVDVDVAAWGASLVSRRVVEAGLLPDADWFFGYEDFDFWLSLRSAGFRLLLDGAAYRARADVVSQEGRSAAFATERPDDHDEPWRAYYVARNFFALRRRHGRPAWTLSHLAKSVRRMQLSGSRAERRATLAGLVDGARGRSGRNDSYLRTTGER